MVDRLGRTIDYMRISVTARCNFRCRYCVPPGGAPCVRTGDAPLEYGEILHGVRKTASRMTGNTDLRERKRRLRQPESGFFMRRNNTDV